ncbi:MAG: hypothetical protein JW927_17250 [Deltaproteobacteria bacterium]|nr:hypothetical protein [Deltaproteobacteria bacterium]
MSGYYEFPQREDPLAFSVFLEIKKDMPSDRILKACLLSGQLREVNDPAL